MKIAKALALAMAIAPAAAFLSVGTRNGHSTTTLNNFMDAYDAQLRQLTGGGQAQQQVAASNGYQPQQQVAAPNGYQPQQQVAAPNVYQQQQQVQVQVNGHQPAATAAEAQRNIKLSQRWRKKTKQLATLGPASSSFEMVEKLFLAGADVFRLNFSHGEHAQKKELLDIIRQIEQKYDHPIAILGDLQGPKLRVGTFANPEGEVLQNGQAFRFDLDETPGTNQRVQLPHPEIIEASQPGHVLLVDDGKVKLMVTGTGPGYIDCEVVVAGKIKDKKVRKKQKLCFLFH